MANCEYPTHSAVGVQRRAMTTAKNTQIATTAAAKSTPMKRFAVGVAVAATTTIVAVASAATDALAVGVWFG